MIQIIITPGDKYSLSEMAQMAMEAGAAWLVLSLPADKDGLRDELSEIARMCREGGIILTAEDLEVAREYSLHGVYIDGAAVSAVQVREDLGPEAIVGVKVASAEAACAMARADIDYVTLNADDSNADAVIRTIREAGCEIPVVAYAPAMKPSVEAAKALLDRGFTGICAGAQFFAGDDPVAEIEELVNMTR